MKGLFTFSFSVHFKLLEKQITKEPLKINMQNFQEFHFLTN